MVQEYNYLNRNFAISKNSLSEDATNIRKTFLLDKLKIKYKKYFQNFDLEISNNSNVSKRLNSFQIGNETNPILLTKIELAIYKFLYFLFGTKRFLYMIFSENILTKKRN